MTKKDYLRALKQEIQALPHNEQKEALEYYENYFLDAGAENEQKVIAELGDVKSLAKEILSNFACVPQKTSKTKEKGSKGGDKLSSTHKWLIVIALVLTFPLWINILVALFGIIVSLLAIGFSGIVAAIAIFVAAIAGIGVASWAFVTNPLVALFVLGACLILIAFGIFAWIIGIWFFSKFVPWVWSGAKDIFNKTRNKIKTRL